MKDVPQNELFSAYLDGELTAAEQAEVEQLLAGSPAARQLLEELRTLSTTLQSLPQYKLSEDLSAQVLRTAERRMLTEPSEPAELPQPARSTGRAILRRVFNSRALVWSSLAVAIAVMLSVMSEDPPREVALGPPAGEEADERVAADPVGEDGDGRTDSRAAPRPDRYHRGLRATDVPDEPVMKAAGPGTVVTNGGTVTGSDTAIDGAVAGSASPATMPSLEKRVPGPGTPAPPPPESLATQKVAPPADAPGGPPKDAGRSPYHYGGEGVDANTGRLASDDGRPQIGKTGGYGINSSSRGVAGVANNGQHAMQSLNSAASDSDGDLRPLPGGYAVVLCDISPKALQTKTFDRLLASNGIALQESVAKLSDTLGTQAGTYVATLTQKRQKQQQAADEKKVLSGAGWEYMPRAGELDLVCVEATQEQIEATLDAVKGQTTEFFTVAVEPALNVKVQEGWARRYNRGRQQDVPDSQPKQRGGGALQEAQAGDIGAGVAFGGGGMAGKGQGTGGEHKLAFGLAWRLKVPEAVARDRLNAPTGGIDTAESRTSAATQRPDSPVPSPPEPAQAPAEEHEGAPPAEPRSGSAAEAEQPGKAPAGSRQPKGVSRPGEPTPKSPGLPKRSDKPADTEQNTRAVQPLAEGRDGFSESGRREKMQEAGGAGQKAAGARSEVGGRQDAPSPMGANQEPAAEGQPKRESALGERVELGRQRRGSQQPRQPVATYRVLFVLRMAGPDVSKTPPAAASMIEQSEPPAVRAAPAKK